MRKKDVSLLDKKFPISREKIRNHFTYSWWIYALILIFAIFGWNLLYTTTRYQSPDYLKVEFYYTGARMDAPSDIYELMEQLHQEQFPDMEVVEYLELALNDDYYGGMTVTLKTMNGEGDVYLMENQYFQEYGLSVMTDLTPYVESGAINVEGLDISSGYMTDPENGKTTLCGIPASHLKGFEEYGITVDNYYLCVPLLNGNTEKAVQLINWFLAEMAAE